MYNNTKQAECNHPNHMVQRVNKSWLTDITLPRDTYVVECTCIKCGKRWKEMKK
jgi:hypothetical protein